MKPADVQRVLYFKSQQLDAEEIAEKLDVSVASVERVLAYHAQCQTHVPSAHKHGPMRAVRGPDRGNALGVFASISKRREKG
jgi:hypothetical protein